MVYVTAPVTLQAVIDTAKANYFYGKAGEDVEEWLVKINHMIEANNVADGRRVAVVAAYLRDTVTE